MKGKGFMGSREEVLLIPPHWEQHSEWLVKGFTPKPLFAAVQGPMSSFHSLHEEEPGDRDLVRPRAPPSGAGQLGAWLGKVGMMVLSKVGGQVDAVGWLNLWRWGW